MSVKVKAEVWSKSNPSGPTGTSHSFEEREFRAIAIKQTSLLDGRIECSFVTEQGESLVLAGSWTMYFPPARRKR